MGTAKPRPMPATAVLTPTTRARQSARAPPELPGFSDASVWMTFSTRRCISPSLVERERPRALTTPEAVGIAQRGGRQVIRARPDDRQVGEAVRPADLEIDLATVDERGGPAVGAGHDVGRCEEKAIGTDYHTGAAAHQLAAPAALAADAEARHRRTELLRDRGDHRGVGVERLALGGRGDCCRLLGGIQALGQCQCGHSTMSSMKYVFAKKTICSRMLFPAMMLPPAPSRLV